MDSYSLGKDIQSIHEKLDRLIAAKRCSCKQDKSSDMRGLSRTVLANLMHEHRELAKAIHESDKSEHFVEKFGLKPRVWCVCCFDQKDGTAYSCRTITAWTRAGAIAEYVLEQNSCIEGFQPDVKHEEGCNGDDQRDPPYPSH